MIASAGHPPKRVKRPHEFLARGNVRQRLDGGVIPVKIVQMDEVGVASREPPESRVHPRETGRALFCEPVKSRMIRAAQPSRIKRKGIVRKRPAVRHAQIDPVSGGGDAPPKLADDRFRAAELELVVDEQNLHEEKRRNVCGTAWRRMAYCCANVTGASRRNGEPRNVFQAQKPSCHESQQTECQRRAMTLSNAACG